MNGPFSDLRYALRSLRRSPWYAAGVVVVLALGIGANAAMFTVLRATLLRPLAFHRPGELVALESTSADGQTVAAAPQDVEAWQHRAHTLEGVAYYANDQLTLTGATAQQQVMAVLASANLFHVLGATPALGRTFTPGEQLRGRNRVVVLSDALWRSQFHADPHVPGHSVRLNDDLFTVIGVMPRNFAFPVGAGREPQLWQPASLQGADTAQDQRQVNAFYEVIGRRAAGYTEADVTRELTTLQGAMSKQSAKGENDAFAPARVVAVDFRHTLDRRQRKAMLALSGAVALLWLIACADVASLLLARVTAKRREFAVRSSLGASRWRVARHIGSEVVVLTGTGTVVGLLLGQAILAIFQRRLVKVFGAGLPLHADAAVLFALASLSLLSAVLWTAVPLWFAVGGSLEARLRADGVQAGTGLRQGRLQRLLVVAELAMTLCLLVGCGLLVRTVLALQQVPLGFRTDHVFSITPNLPYSRYKTGDPNLAVYQPLARRLRALPGVEALAITSVTPLTGHFDVNFMLFPDKQPGQAGTPAPLQAKLRAAGPELQKVLGFRMLEGRFFNAGDTTTAQPVAVVNRAFAREYTATGTQLSHFTLGKGDRAFHVVGVMDDFHQQGIAEPAAPEIDLNGAQLQPTDGFYQPTMKAHAEILLRSSRDQRSLLPELRHALNEINPDLSDADIASMSQIVEDAMGSQLLAEHLLGVLGGLALLVALTGLYSLLAYLVTLRTRELGVRLALGATRGNIVALVLGGAGSLLLAGALAGLVLSLAATHLLRRFLYGVGTYDVRSFSLATAGLVFTGLVAALVPARKAAGIEPTEALRSE